MFRFILFFILVSQYSITLAAPLTKDEAPELLKPWVDWVLQDEDTYQCPYFYNNFQQKQCAWPGALNLELKSKQAQFISQWQVYKEGWIFLPGDKNYWPQNVTINNKPALIVEQQGKPGIKLAAGSYLIKGVFFWDRMPESLAIPENTGLLSLRAGHQAIA